MYSQAFADPATKRGSSKPIQKQSSVTPVKSKKQNHSPQNKKLNDYTPEAKRYVLVNNSIIFLTIEPLVALEQAQLIRK